MSYARFSTDSDVYVFATSSGIECCLCSLQKREWVESDESLFGGYLRSVGEIVESTFRSNEEAIEHLEIHIGLGHAVPTYALELLKDPKDAEENIVMWNVFKQGENDNVS